MKASCPGSIAIALVLMGAASGCSSVGKQSGASMAGIKSSDKSLRTAVEKDPFPKAQGLTAAGKSSTMNK